MSPPSCGCLSWISLLAGWAGQVSKWLATWVLPPTTRSAPLGVTYKWVITYMGYDQLTDLANRTPKALSNSLDWEGCRPAETGFHLLQPGLSLVLQVTRGNQAQPSCVKSRGVCLDLECQALPTHLPGFRAFAFGASEKTQKFIFTCWCDR